jgi:hypothetical protein
LPSQARRVKTRARLPLAFHSERALRTARLSSSPRVRFIESPLPKPGFSRSPSSRDPRGSASRTHSTWQCGISVAKDATGSLLICAGISAAVWVSPALRVICVPAGSRSATA